LIYVGSDDGLVHITTDAGINWSNITPKQMPEWTMVNCIEVDPFTTGKVYVVATSYKSGDYHPYLFVSEDYGKSWTSRVEGINTDHFLRALRADKKVANLLYAGTERGMYISYNGGQNWQEFQLNLPIVPITDLVQVKNDLVVATQGRGFYIIDNLDAVRMAGLDTEQKRMTLIGAEDAVLDFRNTARLVYLVPDTLKKGESLIIDVLDGEGEVIRSWSSEKTTRDTGKIKVELGVNYFRWNLSYPAAKKPDDMILWWASTRGPKAAPGSFTFRITLSDLVETSDFNISINPNYESDSTEYVAKFKFLNEVVEKIDEMHQAIEDMQKISNQINTFISTHAEIDENDTVMISSQAINQELDSLLNDLYQTKMKSEQDPINYPIKLNNRLAHLNTLVSMGSYGPTSQAVMVKNELIGQIDDRLKRFEEIKQKDIIELNALIHNNILDIITTD
jgi:hypothetical protein